MLAQDVIDKFREKANKNGINDNLASDRLRVILAVNEAQIKFTEWCIEKKNEDDNRLVQHLLIETPLVKAETTDNSAYYTLPETYFDLANITAKGRKDKCLVNMLLWETKSQNFNELLADENNKPSHYWAETFYFIGNNRVRIFKTDFTLESVKLTYYRYPRKIDVEGYVYEDGTASSTIHPEWDDKAMDRIISLAVKDFNINAENLQRFQIDANRINNKF